MAKLILHNDKNLESLVEKRAQEIFAFSYSERMKKAFNLMKLSLLFKNTSIKQPQAKGIVLKFK